jgi:hypothetical protein
LSDWPDQGVRTEIEARLWGGIFAAQELVFHDSSPSRLSRMLLYASSLRGVDMGLSGVMLAVIPKRE